MIKNKNVVFGVILFLLIIVAAYLIFSIDGKKNSTDKKRFPSCSEYHTINCYNIETGEIEKESIPCSNDSDCSKEKMKSYCGSLQVSLLECYNVEYFCDNDGHCKGCACS